MPIKEGGLFVIQNKSEDVRLLCIVADIMINPNSIVGKDALSEIDLSCVHPPGEYQQILAGRKTYWKWGKDPTRYRLSSEALVRRIRKDKGLFNINEFVDLVNAFSIVTGYPVGNYDLSKVQGEIVYDASTNEFYNAVGRGSLNLSGIFSLKDELGDFGSSTSDSSRTLIDDKTRKVLVVIYDFSKTDDPEKVFNTFEETLSKMDYKTSHRFIR